MNIPPDLVVSFWKHAAANRDAIAIVEEGGPQTTFGELLDASNRLVHGLRAMGMQPRDCVAVIAPNCVQMLELFMAVSQAGAYLTPINSHLAAPEIAYILQDCGAKAFVCHETIGERGIKAADSAEIPENARFCIGDLAGFRSFSALSDGQPAEEPADRLAGSTMTYTSGTTGKPKGVRRPASSIPPEAMSTPQALFLSLFGIYPGSPGVHIVVSPLYHTAVINFATNHLHLGHTLVLMKKWTPEGMLDAIQRHNVTSSHMVPTQFVRLLKLPAEVKERCDLSSLRHMIHSAAPCPVDVKAAMLDWWGDCIYEYYAASEGGGTLATPQQWRERPGTVGAPWPISTIAIRDDDGAELPAGEPGTVWIRMGTHKFEYHQDGTKTDKAWAADFFTVGDFGYLDDAGFLFLCDRKADMIISGGVNIYPAEIEAALIGHQDVADVAVFGIPDDDWGERVMAVIQPIDGVAAGDELQARLEAFCGDRLARYKQPRAWAFEEQLPRDPNGKLYKRKLRDPYWQGRDRAI